MRFNLISPAIVLRARPFGESDKIVSFFTRDHGKLTGIAKGALRSRRRFVNSLESFSLVNLTFQDRSQRNLAFLISADLVHGPKGLMTDLDRLAHASYLVEITEGLIGEREENPAVFQHLKEGLYHLEENGTSLRFLTLFELKLLRLAGYQPVLDNCKKCHKDCFDESPSQWHFSPLEGGLLCDSCSRSCREVLPLGRTAVEVLTALQADNGSLPARLSLPASVVSEIRSAVLRFIQFHMEREIKSASFLHPFSSV